MPPVRPTTFEDFHGQAAVVETLRVAVAAALNRGAHMRHTLLTGPAGCGKSTIASSVLPTELGVSVQTLNCAGVDKTTDFSRCVSSAAAGAPGSIVFLDEIHALPAQAKDQLLTILEDGRIDVVLEDRVMSVQLPPITIVGATTRQGMLDAPLRSRFSHCLRLETYTDDEMAKILGWTADKHGLPITEEGIQQLVGPAHGVARNAVRLIEACADTLYSGGDHKTVDGVCVRATLDRLGYVGELSPEEHRYVQYLKGFDKPLGLKTIAAALDEEPLTIEEVYEPWLIQRGLVVKTPQGRLYHE